MATLYVLYNPTTRQYVSKQRQYYNIQDPIYTTNLLKAKLFTTPKSALKGGYATYWQRNTTDPQNGPAWIKAPRAALVAIPVNLVPELPTT